VHVTSISSKVPRAVRSAPSHSPVDITERKQAEEALLLSNAELRLHAEQLNRFNRAAVERELRMIELKKEVNQLRQRMGEAAPYPLEFE